MESTTDGLAVVVNRLDAIVAQSDELIAHTSLASMVLVVIVGTIVACCCAVLVSDWLKRI